MPQPNIPNVSQNMELDELRGVVGRMSRNLKYLLTNLDSENVVEAKSVISDWVYTGELNANQITAGTIVADSVSSSWVYSNDIYASQIIVGTLTGFTIQTSSLGKRLVLDNSNQLKGYNDDNVEIGRIRISSDDLEINCSDNSYDSTLSITHGSIGTSLVGGGITLKLENNTYISLYELYNNITLSSSSIDLNATSVKVNDKEVATQYWVENNATITAVFG